MLAVIHVLAGAVIGLAFNNLAVIAVVAFFLHYVMDLLPHLDPETFASKKLPYTWKQSALLLADVVLALGLGFAFYSGHERAVPILVGSLASLLPDFLIPLERYPIFYPLRRFHHMFHWDHRRARRWDGYIAGIVTPTLFVMISSAILWWTL